MDCRFILRVVVSMSITFTMLTMFGYFTGIASAEETSKAGEAGASALKPRVEGYVEGWYRSDNSDLSNQTTESRKVDNEFRVRRARIDVKGDVTDKAGYRVTGNFDGPSPASGTASVKLWDGYLTYKITPLANITVGQFKYPFTLEGLEGTPDRVPVLRAESINDIAGKLGTKGGSFRDIGVKLDGEIKDLKGLTYGIALINGAGINSGDNNGKKDLVGRVTASPLKGLRLGFSGYAGRGEGELSAVSVKKTAYGLDGEYVSDSGLRVRGEYLTARWKNWDVATSAASSGKTQKPAGWYLQASYKPQSLQFMEFMARYEDYEKDSDTGDSHLKTTTLGVTYYLKGKSRITANYLIRDAGNSSIVTAQETDATGSRIGNLVLVQAITVF
ncbi:MAG: hypothetical protein IT393_06935 [Nitrospirae bacterium]|nr:hypothetical protein [Nitrospirota bacterium]